MHGLLHRGTDDAGHAVAPLVRPTRTPPPRYQRVVSRAPADPVAWTPAGPRSALGNRRQTAAQTHAAQISAERSGRVSPDQPTLPDRPVTRDEAPVEALAPPAFAARVSRRRRRPILAPLLLAVAGLAAIGGGI